MDQIQQNFIRPINHKKMGAIFGGDFQNWGRTQQNQARKQRGEAPKSWSTWLMIPRWCRVEPYVADLSRKERNPWRTRRTRGRTERKHKGKHSRTSPITHPLDNQTHKIHKVHEQQRERYKVRFISMRRSWRGPPKRGSWWYIPQDLLLDGGLGLHKEWWSLSLSLE